MQTALITGAAGFIGFHLCQRLLADGFSVVGVDNFSDYYDVTLKQARFDILRADPKFQMHKFSVETKGAMLDLFAQTRPDVVVHLAAQAGVRWSLENPRAYLDSNISGSFEMLEAARAHPPRHMLMASTSSVYGANTAMPYREIDRADHQMSFYAATKKACEAMAQSYAHLHDLPITMFRFFTVYGPWGRPDMALFKFTKAILQGHPIDVYNFGQMKRDFTYIDDLIEGVRRLIDAPPQPIKGAQIAAPDSLSPVAPWRVVNIGNSEAMALDDFITAIERATGQVAQRNLLPLQPGDVPATWADVSLLRALTGFVPSTPIETGVAKFVAWYRGYYGV